MGDKSKISWTDATWNPLAGCTRVSRGCDHCYAFELHDRRYAANKAAGMAGGGYEPKPKPFPKQYDLPFSKLQLLPDRLDQPLHWKKPRRIFVNSMSDLFHEDVPDEFIARVFAVMGAANQHTFQVLTKRPGRMRTVLEGGGFLHATVAELGVEYASEYGTDWPLPNVWLGVSVEDQAAADERIPLLVKTPAAKHWISAEPLLGPVDLRMLNMGKREWQLGEFDQYLDVLAPSHTDGMGFERTIKEHHRLDWLVLGDESGPHFRPMDLRWAHMIRAQCQDAGVPYFGKQNSGARPGIALPGDLGDREWP